MISISICYLRGAPEEDEAAREALGPTETFWTLASNRVVLCNAFGPDKARPVWREYGWRMRR